MINDTTKFEPKQIPNILTDAHLIADHIVHNLEAVSVILWNRSIEPVLGDDIETTCAMGDIHNLVEKILYIEELLKETIFTFSGGDADDHPAPANSDEEVHVVCFRYYLDTCNDALDRSIVLGVDLHTNIYGTSGLSDDDGYGCNEYAPALTQLDVIVEKLKVLESCTTSICNAF